MPASRRNPAKKPLLDCAIIHAMPVETIPPIEEMTANQKVELMEALWDSMSRKKENAEPPAWHGDVLEERRNASENGETEYIDWEDAKDQIRSRLK
jgi:hypothetical protein